MQILIVGLGSIAKKHIDAIRKLNPNVKIYALRRNNSSSSEQHVQSIYNITELENETLDFAIISNPTAAHLDTIQELSHLSVPLFIEKPLFSEISTESENLVNFIDNSNILTYVACNLRFLNCLIYLREKITKERINEVNVYCGSYLPNWRPGVDFRKVYSANKEMGGGVHIDLIHELDYVYWLFGKPNRSHSFFSNHSSLDISAFDYANYLWTYKEFSASIILNYYRKESKRTIEIVTDEGVYMADLLENKVFRDGETIFESDQKIIDTYDAQMQFFIENIINNKKNFNSISEANTILRLCMQD